jgi:hypothetical protein
MAPSALFNGYRWSSPMSQHCHFEASRSLAALEQDSTLIAVIEMSQSKWLVAALVPGVERQPLKKLWRTGKTGALALISATNYDDGDFGPGGAATRASSVTLATPWDAGHDPDALTALARFPERGLTASVSVVRRFHGATSIELETVSSTQITDSSLSLLPYAEFCRTISRQWHLMGWVGPCGGSQALSEKLGSRALWSS